MFFFTYKQKYDIIADRLFYYLLGFDYSKHGGIQNMKSYLSLIIFIFVVIVAVANAADGMYLEVMTDEATIKFKEEEFDASGGILFKYDDIKIKAFKIKKVKDKNVVIAKNKVIFQQGDKTVECDEIEVNLDTKEAIIKDGGTMMDKIYYGGEMFDAKFPDIAVVRNAYFSTCNLEDPHYHFEAKKIEFYPGRKIVAYNTFII
jgi:lipopolysaccharide assembly outer membrane protein LptD (OstA)